MIQWQDLHHSDLTVHSLYALLKLRWHPLVAIAIGAAVGAIGMR